jgi:hypothetical protein
MNIILGCLVYLPAILAGGLLVHFLWHGTQPSRLLFKAGLGIGLGLGLTSLITFLILLVTNSLSGLMPVQFTLLLGSLALTRRTLRSNPIAFEKPVFSRLQKILLGVFVLTLLITASAYILYALMTPTGRFDAWMIYNRTARFIFRDPVHWRNALSPQLYPLFHADYPWLVPMNVAGAWNALDGEIIRVAQAQSTYFLLGVFCLLMGALGQLRTTGQALLGGITLLAVPVFFYVTAREEADIPCAFFILATLALLFLYNQERNPMLVALAGLTTGLAAWTKNEGSLFLITGTFAWLMAIYRRHKLHELKWYVLGFALPVMVLIYFKLFLAPPGDVLNSSGSANGFNRLMMIERYAIVAKYFYDQIFIFGEGKLNILLILIFGLIIGLDKSRVQSQPILPAMTAIFLQLAGYFLIYILTPYEINWHIRNSLYRLMVQLFPSMLLIFFTAVKDPETLFGEVQNPQFPVSSDYNSG